MNFSQSKVKMFRRCQKQYSFRYDYPQMFGGEDGEEMVRKVHSLPLTRGTWMHELQAALHRQWAGVEGADWRASQEAMTEQFNALFEEERADLGDLPTDCERLFKSYLRFWKDDQDTYSVATLHDGEPAVEFLVEVPFGRGRAFKGTIDLLVEDDEYGGLWVWDAKWVGKIPAPDERMMSPQNLMYVWALRKLDYDIRGFVYNYGRTKPPTIPPQLKRTGMITTRKSLDTDVATYLREVKRVHGDRWKEYVKHVYAQKIRELRGREGLWFRRERIPVEDARIYRGLAEFKSSVLDIETRFTEDIPRSYFYNCKFGCEYHNLCVAEFQGLDIAPLIKKDYIFEGERYAEVDLLKD